MIRLIESKERSACEDVRNLNLSLSFLNLKKAAFMKDESTYQKFPGGFLSFDLLCFVLLTESEGKGNQFGEVP